jgi:hypothetical protein
MHQNDVMLKQVADLQWKSLVDSIKSSSTSLLTNCMAVADVSGSMGRIDGLYGRGDKNQPQPIEVCVALTLLLGELAEEPWSGGYFTFSSKPKFETIDINLSLSERAERLVTADWEMSTCIDKLFDLILTTAKRQNLAPEHMIKKLFVFSDMQFDAATTHYEYGLTEHQNAVRKFEEAGYPMPDIVYWNLAGRYDASQPTSKPAQADTPGVELMSGYSGALMKQFMNSNDEDAEISDDEEDGTEKEWEHVDEKGAGQEGKKTKQRRKPTPLELVKKVVNAESLSGVAIVD